MLASKLTVNNFVDVRGAGDVLGVAAYLPSFGYWRNGEA